MEQDVNSGGLWFQNRWSSIMKIQPHTSSTLACALLRGGVCFSAFCIWGAHVIRFHQQNAIRVTPHGSRGWAFRGFALLLSFFLLECRPGTPCKAADLAQGRLGGLGRRTEAPWPAACPNGQTRCQSEAISDLQPRQPTS